MPFSLLISSSARISCQLSTTDFVGRNSTLTASSRVRLVMKTQLKKYDYFIKFSWGGIQHQWKTKENYWQKVVFFQVLGWQGVPTHSVVTKIFHWDIKHHSSINCLVARIMWYPQSWLMGDEEWYWSPCSTYAWLQCERAFSVTHYALYSIHVCYTLKQGRVGLLWARCMP